MQYESSQIWIWPLNVCWLILWDRAYLLICTLERAAILQGYTRHMELYFGKYLGQM